MDLIKDIDIQKLCDYLGLNVSDKKLIQCINPYHIDDTPSMNIYKNINTIGCFGCGRHYNTIQLYQEIKNTNQEEAIEELKKLYNQFKISNSNNEKQTENIINKYDKYQEKIKNISFKYHDKIKNYFNKRNIPNSIEYMNTCGYRTGLNKDNKVCYVFPELIIEVTEGYPKYLNWGNSSPITLNYYENTPFMIVEGIVDGLTAIHMNYNAVVLNGVGNVSKIDVNKKYEYIIALDRDEAGVKNFEKLEKKLKNCKYSYYEKLYLSRCKDLNDLLKIKQSIEKFGELKDKYIDKNIIGEILEYKKSLFVAPTGKGKTTAIFDYCLSNSIDEIKYIVACPNKIQNAQNENTFDGVQAIIEGVKIDFDINVYSVVYDRVYDTLKSLMHWGYKVILIVDEAHNLVYAKDYRKRAIKELLNAELMAFKSLRVTATPDTILNDTYDFKYIISDFKLNIKHCKILQLHGNRKNNLLDIIERYHKSFDKTMVYVNEKEIQNVINEKFDFDILNSDTAYDEDVYKNITENNTIKRNLTTTSVLQAGANINLPGEKVCFIYHCKSVLDLNYEHIIQSVSRVRTGIDTLIITTGESKDIKIQSYAESRAYKSSKIDKKLKEVKKYVYEMFKQNPHTAGFEFDGYITKEIHDFNNSYDKYEKKQGLNAINMLNIDYLEIEKQCMSEYNKQFYYNAQLLLNKLNLDGEIIDYVSATSLQKGESKMLEGREKFNEYKEELNNTSNTVIDLCLNNSNMTEQIKLFDTKYFSYNKELRTIRYHISDIDYIKKLISNCTTVKELKEIPFIIQCSKLDNLYKEDPNSKMIAMLPFGPEYKLIRETIPLKTRISNKKLNSLMSKLKMDDKLLKSWINRIYNISNDKPSSTKNILKNT